MKRKRLNVALVYNSLVPTLVEASGDLGSTAELRCMIRSMASDIRSLGHRVTILPLGQDLLSFHRRLRKIKPDVVFNQYDDVVHGALYEMRAAALISMLGYPMTGSPPQALGLARYKYVCASLLQGAGIPVPENTELIDKISMVDSRSWKFPLIVQPCREDAGIGLDRRSVVDTKKALKEKVRWVVKEFRQPALVQRFLSGREFTVGIIGGRRLRVLPLTEIDYSELQTDIPPILSYAAKWLENTPDFKGTAEICPAEVEPELARQICRTAILAFQVVGGWGYGRVDIRLDENDVPRVLEVNCNAALEDDNGLARQAKVAGIDFPHLLQLVIEAALDRPPFDVVLPMD